MPIAAWRAFAPSDIEPPDVRIRWFVDAIDKKRLRETVSKQLQSSLRWAWKWPPSPPPHVVEVSVDKSWGALVSTLKIVEAPTEATQMPRPEFLAKLVAEFAGEPASRYRPSATYAAEVSSDGGTDIRLEVLDNSLDRVQLLHTVYARIGNTLPRLANATGIHLQLYPDGSTSYGATTAIGGLFRHEEELIAAARADLRARLIGSE